MRKSTLLLVFIAASVSLIAQKKSITWEQAFKNGTSAIFKSLPPAGSWIDNEHYTEYRDGETGNSVLFSVDVKSGKAVPYASPAAKTPYPDHRERPRTDLNWRINALSPDGSWQAFVKKDNNLYIQELATGKIVQLTTDGSETVLNGYASWVYYEEILGRQSHYRAFWWSPDSKRLAF